MDQNPLHLRLKEERNIFKSSQRKPRGLPKTNFVPQMRELFHPLVIAQDYSKSAKVYNTTAKNYAG